MKETMIQMILCGYRSLIMSHEGNNDPDDPIWIMVCEDHPNLTHEERLRIFEDLKGD